MKEIIIRLDPMTSSAKSRSSGVFEGMSELRISPCRYGTKRVVFGAKTDDGISLLLAMPEAKLRELAARVIERYKGGD